MAENVVINDTTYNGVDALSLVRSDGSVATFYPDAVRYNTQNLTEAQKVQACENIGITGSVYCNTVTENLNDEVYEYGYLNTNGSNNDSLTPITTSFRTKNYIPVEGGRKICFNWVKADLNASNNVQVVQYAEDKTLVVERTPVTMGTNKWSNGGITLNANTRYVRLAWYTSIADLSTVKVNVYYYEDREKMWANPGDVFNYVPHFISEKIGDYVPFTKVQSPLTGKKIVYDGDSIAESRTGSSANNGGGYAKLIADRVGGKYVNHAKGGARLTTKPSDKTYHSVVDNLPNLPKDGDLYCFEGGINDYWTPKTLGTFSKTDFAGTLDTNTICGALETIFRYALNAFTGKPICFVIAHKIQSTAYAKNSNGDTFEDYRNAMVGICEKYSIPYYDAFSGSGLNGWNTAQNNTYLTSNTDGTADGIHPNEEGYKRYYVPQLISLFERIIPIA